MNEKAFLPKIYKEFDVTVCGGGIAGTSAALAAARQGKKTILIENQFLLGGLATSGLVTIYLPLCDGMGHQVSFGIAEELLRLSIKYGAEENIPENWCNVHGSRTKKDPRLKARYNAQVFAILLEQELLKAGVEILYGTRIVGVNKNNNKIDHIIFENKSGRMAIKTRSIVDATGDCDIAFFSDLATREFNKGNDLAAWYYYVNKDAYDLNFLGFLDVPNDDASENRIKIQNTKTS